MADEPDGLEEIWRRLARPFSTGDTVSAITGLSRSAIGELSSTVLATSDEALDLLDSFPRSVRALGTSMSSTAERCIGELRGPVLWSETLSARASSFGDPDLYICSSPRMAYDIAENRVLVAALAAVAEGARTAVEHIGGEARYEDPAIGQVLHNGNLALRALEHPSLKDVKRGRPTAREMRRARSSKRRKTYDPAVRLLDRAEEPLGVGSVRTLCDRRTRAQHRMLARVITTLEELHDPLPPIRAERGVLMAGPVRYRHPARRVGREGPPAGVTIGDVLMDVPEGTGQLDVDREAAALAERSEGHQARLVVDLDQVEATVVEAITLATSA